MEALIMIIGILFLLPVLAFYQAFCWGYVSSVLYIWFVIPLFPEAPQIFWYQFSGLIFLYTCFSHRIGSSIKEEYKDKKAYWITFVTSPWMTLLCAQLFKTFVY